MELFTKNAKLPEELRPLRYDFNSVTHFGDRDFSKNGHRTIMFKDPSVRQNRKGLSDLDVRKIELIYGPECQKRDRQEKIDLCQNYPGVARRKREIDLTLIGPSLRVNRDITVPPARNPKIEISSSLDHLGIEDELYEILDKIHTTTSVALKNARNMYCNNSDSNSKSNGNVNEKVFDILGIVNTLTVYVESIVDHAADNLTAFCKSSNTIEQYHLDRCRYYSDSRKCKNVYESRQHRIDSETDTATRRVRHKREAGLAAIVDPPNPLGDADDKSDTFTIKANTSNVETVQNVTIKQDPREIALKKMTKYHKPETTAALKHTVENEEVVMRRRFGDFRVYKKKDDTPQTYESDLSLEPTRQEKIVTRKPMKYRPTHNKTNMKWSVRHKIK